MSTDRDERDALAGLYVLGQLTEAEARAFEARLSEDQAARAAVRTIRERLGEIDDAAPAEPVPPALWERIEARLGAAPDFGPLPGNVVQMGKGKAAGLLRNDFWRGALAACLATVITLGTLFSLIDRGPPQPRLVVVLLTAEAEPGMIVEALGDREVRVVPLEAFVIPEGKAIELWTLPDPATGPVSLGLLREAAEKRLVGPRLPPPQPEQLYEITLEPATGSPTGRPTGPVLAKGYARVPQI